MVQNGEVRIICTSIFYSKLITLNVCYMILFSNITSDLTDTELDLKIKFCNELLCLLDTLNCGDCRKRGKRDSFKPEILLSL